MECIFGNEESSIRDFGDSLQLTNWILDSGATCHMKPQFSYLFSGSLEDTDKYIKLENGKYVMAKQKVKLKYQCVTITDTLSSQCCTAYFWYRTYAMLYPKLSR